MVQQKLTSAQVTEIRHRYATGQAGYQRLAHEYGVDRTTMRAIVRRQTYREVPDCGCGCAAGDADAPVSTAPYSQQPEPVYYFAS